MNVLKTALLIAVIIFAHLAAHAQQTEPALTKDSGVEIGLDGSNSKTLSDSNQPLMIIKAGKKTYSLAVDDPLFKQAIVPDEIESIEVLKGGKAIEKFGEMGANGVVIIQMKDGIQLDLPRRMKYNGPDID